jgi:putative restriction endonuclease
VRSVFHAAIRSDARAKSEDCRGRRLLGRTPSSLAMKLVNFASLDAAQRARGIRGLSRHSRADEKVWGEFQADWDHMTILSEARLHRLQGEDTAPLAVGEALLGADVPTETKSMVKVRIMQSFFRKAVLAAYNSTCCITGNPVDEILVASHILPWSDFPKERLNPRNGLCLAAHFDRLLIAV